MTLANNIKEAASRGLHEIVLRESVGGWQAIAKFHGALMGPWSVGCDPDPVTALMCALGASAVSEMTTDPTTQEDIFG